MPKKQNNDFIQQYLVMSDKHGQSFKTRVGHMTEYFCAKYTTSGCGHVSPDFFRVYSLSRNKRVEFLYRHFSLISVRTHHPEQEQEHAHQCVFKFTEVIISSAQVTGLHKINSVTKEVCFWL